MRKILARIIEEIIIDEFKKIVIFKVGNNTVANTETLHVNYQVGMTVRLDFDGNEKFLIENIEISKAGATIYLYGKLLKNQN
ncbi:hypothetical protein [Flavobacterium chungangensis]|uniref:Uncharacterized protein n=1 Tax=Flavobacterium chungangensis TaxID=2708132 RepID=A0ABV8ZFR5_9FLAO